MTTIVPTLNIDSGNQTHVVSQLSPAMQLKVAAYDDIRQQLHDCERTAYILQSAFRVVVEDLQTGIQAHEAELATAEQNDTTDYTTTMAEDRADQSAVMVELDAVDTIINN